MTRIKLFAAAMLAIMLIGAAEVAAQNHREPHSTIQVTFFPPMSTNGGRAHLYTNDLSFNVLVGVSKNERAFAFAGLGNIVLDNADGFQFAGLLNHTGGRGFGAQFAGLANIVHGDYEGFQFGGLFNTASELEGFQFGGLANVVRDVDGSQLSGLANVARDVEGFQFGGLANVARDVEGFQFGGLFNVARRVRGVQFAGLVNVAERSDYPIGIVNIVREGEMGVGIGYNEVGTTSLNFRSGGRVLYGILGVGYNHRTERRRDAPTVTAGYGAHIRILPWLRINNELTAESFGIFRNDGGTFKSAFAVMPAFSFGRFELFGGPSIDYMRSDDPAMFRLFPKSSLWKEVSTKSSYTRMQQLFVGWQVGVQFIL